VEVPGVEPGSAEPLASASPSAAVGELFGRWDPNGGLPSDLSGVDLCPPVPEPGGRIPHCGARFRRGGHPPGGRAAI